MVDTLIIGGGLSALSAKLAIGDTADLRILSHPDKDAYKYEINRSRCFEINKLFQKHASSLASFSISNKNLHLYDRAMLGGHSRVWGGFVDTEFLNKKILAKFRRLGINFESVNHMDHSYKSNHKFVSQMSSGSKIMDAGRMLLPDYFGHLISIDRNNGVNKVIYKKSSNSSPEFIYAKRVILCLGIVQTLNFIINNMKSDGIIFSLSEHEHSIKLQLRMNRKICNDGFIMDYSIVAAIKHFLGIRSRSSNLAVLGTLIPLFVRQKFSNNLRTCKFFFKEKLQNSYVIESISKLHKFGTSIHSFNLKINDIPLDDYFAVHFPGIINIGASSIKKCKPGPISNYIIIDAFKKLS